MDIEVPTGLPPDLAEAYRQAARKERTGGAQPEVFFATSQSVPMARAG